MANIYAFVENMTPAKPIPLDGDLYFAIGPDSRLASGAVTVTAHATSGAPGGLPQYLEVTQMATRMQAAAGGSEHYLDIVVRNNGHVGDSSGEVASFAACVAVVNP